MSKRFICHIFQIFIVSTFTLQSTFANTCSQYEAEISKIHQQQDEMQLTSNGKSKSFSDLKKQRDAAMANLLALRSLRKVRDEYTQYKKDSMQVDIASLLDDKSKAAIEKIENYTQAIAKYGVLHPIVDKLAQIKTDDIDTVKDKNFVVRVMMYLKEGHGRSLYGYIRTKCNGLSASIEDIEDICHNFKSFTKNFSQDDKYQDSIKATINNYGELLEQMYLGDIDKEEFEERLGDHIEALYDNSVKIELQKQGDTYTMVRNESKQSFPMLTSNTDNSSAFKNIFEDDFLRIKDETPSLENYDESESAALNEASQKLKSNINEENEAALSAYNDIRKNLSKLKDCRGKISTCSFNNETAKDLVSSINKLNARIGYGSDSDKISTITITNDDKDKIRERVQELLASPLDDIKTLNLTSGNKLDYKDIITKYLNEFCKESTVKSIALDSGEIKDDPLYRCIESELNDDALNQKIAEAENQLKNQESLIAKLFNNKAMKELEVVKAIVLKTYDNYCKGYQLKEISCLPPVNGEDSNLKALVKVQEGAKDILLTEDYSRYYYGGSDTDDERQSQAYLNAYCPETRTKVCGGKVVEVEVEEGQEEASKDKFPNACNLLHNRMCNQKTSKLYEKAVKLKKKEYYDWDPISERMVKKRHAKDFWPEVAMYAAQNSYRFMGPMIATQSLRGQIPGQIYAGQANEQRMAYQEQYYDWYMENLDLSNSNMFNTYYGSPFYSGSSYTNNFGYAF